MAQITAAQVKELREKTDLPMMDCKKALVEADGDLAKAEDLLRKSGAATAAKKADRVTAEGRVGTYISDDGKTAGIVEMRCETAPVSNNDDFKALADMLANHAATIDPMPADVAGFAQTKLPDGRTVQDAINDVIQKIRENMQVGSFGRVISQDGYVANYVHFNGQVGALVEYVCPSEIAGNEEVQALMRDICMQVVALDPEGTVRDDIDSALVEKEREIIAAQVAAEKKPANIIEKIIEGKLDRWFSERVLVEQAFVKEDKKTVKQVVEELGKKLGGQIEVRSFVRMHVGRVQTPPE